MGKPDFDPVAFERGLANDLCVCGHLRRDHVEGAGACLKCGDVDAYHNQPSPCRYFSLANAMTTRQEFERAEEEDRKTIAALLKAGCSLPDRLQKKYDAYAADMKERMFAPYMLRNLSSPTQD